MKGKEAREKIAIENILREEMVTIGTSVKDAKTGQMWAFDAERLAKRIIGYRKPKGKPPLLTIDEVLAEMERKGWHRTPLDEREIQ